MKLYMVRHGQSETNLERRFTGWSQVKLTQQGIEDARRAGSYLNGLHFDRVYASDLIRAVQTAKYALPGCEPIQSELLREINVGSLGRRKIDECHAQYGEALAVNRRNYNFVPYGGENREMMEQRVRRFFRMLENDLCEQAAAFAHAGTLQTALDIVMGAQLDRSHLICPNGSVAVFEYNGTNWRLLTWGGGI